MINRVSRTLIQAARFLVDGRPTANDMASSVPETLTKMKRQHTYRREKDRIGAQGCIYCNGPAPLTLEHIIPENIGGMLTIERASCAFCAGETGAFEGHACLGMLPMRRQMRFPQKRRGAKDRERRKAELLF